jgi:hypothetical protein
MRRLLRRYWWAAAGLAIIIAPIAWYLGSPLFINRVVDEPFPTSGTPDFPMSKDAVIPPGMTQQQAEDEMMDASRQETAASDKMPAGADQGMIVVRGTLAGKDDVHKGEGTASVYRVGGQVVLRLDPFRVTNGPDLYVYLSGHSSPRTSAQLHEAGALEVARLKGNVGSQNYGLPADLDIGKFKSVVIYCRRFSAVFARAPLGPVQ